MNKLIVSAILAVTSISSLAQDSTDYNPKWETLMNNRNVGAIYYDTNSKIVDELGRNTMWFKSIWVRPNIDGISYSYMLHVIDCNTREFGSQKLVAYDINGNEIMKADIPAEYVEMKPVSSSELAGAMYRILCY